MSKYIFVEKQVKCPSCLAIFTLTYPNPKMYAATARDEFQRVTGYSWTSGIDTDVVPHYYSVAQCPHCMVADFQEKFENPAYDPKAKKVYDALKKASKEQRAVFRKLKKLVPASQVDGPGAIALHLAAIFTALLPAAENEESIDHMKLGRVYLRLSGLYGEVMGTAGPDREGAAKPKKSKTTTISQLLGVVEELEDDLEKLLEKIEKVRELTEKRSKELNLTGNANPYADVVDAIENKLEEVQQELGGLEETVIKDKKKILMVDNGNATKPAEKENGQSNFSLEEALADLATQWPQMPNSDMDAMKLAAEALEYSYTNESGELREQQSMSLGLLLMQLYHRIGNLDHALDYSIKIYKTGFRDKQSLQNNIAQAKRDGAEDDGDIKNMTRTLTAVTNMLNKAAEGRREIMGLIYERDKDTINKAIQAKAGAPVYEIEQALFQAGISENVVDWLKEKQMLKEDPKKKKWFGK